MFFCWIYSPNEPQVAWEAKDCCLDLWGTASPLNMTQWVVGLWCLAALEAGVGDADKCAEIMSLILSIPRIEIDVGKF